MEEKLITLVIPTIHNDIPNLNQIDSNFELLIIRDTTYRGPALTRQEGLNQVKTPYVMFMDDDDYLSPACIHLFNKIIREQQPDVIIGEVTKITLGGDVISNWNKVTSAWTWLHGKCYRTEFLRENNIYFPETLRYNEDVYFNTLVRECADEDNIIAVDTPVYFFTSSSNSMCGQIKQDMDKYIEERQSYLKCAYLTLPHISKPILFRQALNIMWEVTNILDYYNIPHENYLPELLKIYTPTEEDIVSLSHWLPIRDTSTSSNNIHEAITYKEWSEKYANKT